MYGSWTCDLGAVEVVWTPPRTEPDPRRSPLRRQRTRPEEPPERPEDRALLTELGPRHTLAIDGPPSRAEDPKLWAVHDEFRRVAGAVELIGEAIRDAFDQAYDGQNSGRWDYRQ